MPNSKEPLSKTLPKDVISGLVVFLVALPLCLGVAIASGAPPFAGIVAGIIGGILVGILSGSNTSVSGPSPSFTVIIATQLAILGSFETLLMAVMLAGFFQIGLGFARAGFLSAFVPTSVIQGLLAAIGVGLILKQIPHILGHDADPEGENQFFQPDGENTFTELLSTVNDIEPAAAIIGLTSIAILIVWGRWKVLKNSPVPSALGIVLYGIGASQLLALFGETWTLGESHLVNLPVPKDFGDFFTFFTQPDFSQWRNKAVYAAAFTIAAVASLESLLNLEAVDKIDPYQRISPTNRELFAQGVGNVTCGLLGGLPISSVIVRSSVNINAGTRTKLSAIFHGLFLLVCVALLSTQLNKIPLACFGAILLMTGIKLASPAIMKQMWNEGRYQFIPFAVTLVAIVMTDLLIGVLIGLAVSLGFILNSNLRRPLKMIVEKHLGGDVLHIELANQVSFLNRASLSQTLDSIHQGGHVLIDAQHTDYIDPDILSLIRDFKNQSAPVRGVQVSLLGFRNKYHLENQTQYVDYSTRELQEKLTPAQVLQILKDGHARFRSGKQLTRDFNRTVNATGQGQHPLAVVLGCIDSRSPAEIIFDVGVGDIFVSRIAGNIAGAKIIGSIEYACAVAGAKLILVLGHTSCGAVTAAVSESYKPTDLYGCGHIRPIIDEIQKAIPPSDPAHLSEYTPDRMRCYVNDVARRNVERTILKIKEYSTALRALVMTGQIAIIGAMYNVASGEIEFIGE